MAEYDAPWVAAKSAQRKLGVTADGVWGPRSVAAYNAAPPSLRLRIDEDMRRVNLSPYSVGRVTTTVAAPRSVKEPFVVLRTSPKSPAGAVKARPAVAGNGSGKLRAAMTSLGYPPETVNSVVKQFATEAGGRLLVSEDHRIGLPFIRKNMSGFNKMSDAQVVALQAAGPEAFFNVAYRGRIGNTDPSDGFKYRGRGPLQLTGKGNYRAVGKELGVDLVADPDWITRNEENAIASVVAYLKTRGVLNTTSVSGAKMAHLVNPGLRRV